MSDHANTIDGSLSDCSELGLRVAADLVDNLGVERSKEVWAEVLNHIVEDEQKELLLGLGVVLGNLWEDLRDKLLDKVVAVIFVSLKDNADDLAKLNLELLLVLVLFFENLEVLFVKSIFFITLGIFLLILVVLLDSVFRLGNELKDLGSELVDAGWLKKVSSSLLDNLLDGLSLADEAISLGLRFHGLDQVV